MKKIILSFVVAAGFVGFVSAAQAAPVADRCQGLVPDLLIQAESVQDMYFDMRLHELMCHYVQKDQTALNKLAASIGSFKNRYATCIVAAQNKLIENLGNENTFDNFYAKLGNQIVLLNTNDPCGRALKLSQALMAKPMTCGSQLTSVYASWFAGLDKAYIAKTKSPLHRICDKTDPAQ